MKKKSRRRKAREDGAQIPMTEAQAAAIVDAVLAGASCVRRYSMGVEWSLAPGGEEGLVERSFDASWGAEKLRMLSRQEEIEMLRNMPYGHDEARQMLRARR